MEEFRIQLLAILTLLTQTSSPSDTTELIGAVGGSVTFHSPKTEGNAALWSFGNVSIVSVVFEDPPQLVFLKEEYRTRLTVSEDGRALTISPLRMEDAGTYSVKINGKKSTFILRVYEELPEPTVTYKSLNCSDGICLISLRCSVSGAGFGNVSYTWRMGSWLWDEGSVMLRVNKSASDNWEPVTCTVWNAVSRRNVTITIPGGLYPGTPSGSSVGMAIPVIVGVTVVVVILLVFLVLFCKCKGYRPRARLVSGLSEISAPVRWLGPSLGLAMDQL